MECRDATNVYQAGCKKKRPWPIRGSIRVLIARVRESTKETGIQNGRSSSPNFNNSDF